MFDVIALEAVAGLRRTQVRDSIQDTWATVGGIERLQLLPRKIGPVVYVAAAR